MPSATWSPPAEPVADPSPAARGPEATLKAFLGAGDWNDRLSLSLPLPGDGRESLIRPGLEGPIEVTQVSLLAVNPDSHIFRVHTAELPDGFPAAVARRGDAWRVDLATFAEFYRDHFRQFVAGGDVTEGTFHLLVNRLESDDPAEHYRRYALNPPMSGREQTGFVRRDQVVEARLGGIFDDHGGYDEKTFAKLVEGAGLPLVLRLARKTTAEGQHYLLIEEVVGIGWNPDGTDG